MKKLRLLFAAVLMLAALCAQASALEYTFEGPACDDYYKETSYEDVYGSQYNYGGPNVVDYAAAPELPGYHSSVQVLQPMTTTGTVTPSYNNTLAPDPWGNWTGSGSTVTQIPFTPASSLVRSDGSIGTLKISSLDINFKVYDGETNASMKKGLGHFASTTAWNGNICICGHNRGSSHNIGSIKNLSIGDTIKYTTSEGTRTYHVTFVGKISATDWSYLTPTEDNRITLFTCSENEPDYRWCVQATQA